MTVSIDIRALEGFLDRLRESLDELDAQASMCDDEALAALSTEMQETIDEIDATIHEHE